MDSPRTVQFTITAWVDADHKAYEDPEWVADAAAGALANVYGIQCVYTDIQTVRGEGAV